MAKPASGTALDSGNSLFSSLTAVWAFLEGSSGSSADSKGTRTLTLNSGSWQTDGAGDACWRIAAANASPVSFSSALTVADNTSWSLAWRSKTLNADTQAMLCGDNTVSTDFIWLYNNTTCNFRSTVGTDFNFSTTPTTMHDYLLVVDDTNNLIHLWVDGSQIGTGQSLVAQDSAFNINTIGNGYTGSGFSFIGDISYIYQWSGRALVGADASTLTANPYSIFQAGGGGGAAKPYGDRFLKQAVKRASFY